MMTNKLQEVEMITIKSVTRTGKPAAQASEKQIKFANDIVARINAVLREITDMGYADYANEASAKYDRMTDAVESGPRDVIEYLKNVTRHQIFSDCYGMARRDQNFEAVDKLHPMKNQ